MTTWRQSTPVFITLNFSADETLLRRFRAMSKATRAMRSISPRVIDLRVDGALRAVLERHDLLRLAEIDAAGEFAHDDDVETLDDLALQRGCVGQRRIADRRANIGEQAEILAQAQQAGLGAHGIGNRIPFRPADGAEEHGVGLPARASSRRR